MKELKSINEKVINQALKKALREKDATKAIDIFLQILGENTSCERIYIFEGKKGSYVANTFEWCAEGVNAEKDDLQQVPFEAVKWFYNAFEKKSSIIIEDAEAIKDSEPLTYEYLKQGKINSLIAAPLLLEDCIIGFYGIDNPSEEIMGHIEDFAEIVGHFMVSLLEKRRLIRQLEKLSMEDSLSDVKNRHALNRFMEAHPIIQKSGVVYCDVLGLKKINDSLGHQAGDDLIVRAGECLKKNFDRENIYRIGGDEFLVLCQNMEKEEFLSKVATLRKDMKIADVEISFGVLWNEEVEDIDAFVAKADELMYEEKRTYYSLGKKN